MPHMDATQWNQLVFANEPRSGAFLQSSEWADFQEAAGARVLRYMDEGACLANVILRPLPFGQTAAAIMRGPIFSRAQDNLGDLLSAIKKTGAITLQVDPLTATRPPGTKPFHARSPQTTLLLDLRQTEEVLLAAMHEKKRYNIRYAERAGVTVRRGGVELFPELWALLEAAATRDRFRTHPKQYYETMLRVLTGDPRKTQRTTAQILLAEYQGKAVAGMILVTFGKTATYLHGGSANEYRNIMAPHLLQWEAIRFAKSWGYEAYDFWGIAPEKAVDHPLAGVTRFKRGFGGTTWHAPDSFELPLREPWYTIYALVRQIRKMRIA
jgi:lipid II:glycine glycyltransferase (peptidoglycan interpeptide bridge formation enzyme)